MGEKPTLIYLDDEEINLILFKEMFKRDFEVFTTTSPEAAIEFVENNEVPYVLTDQMMPVMTGVQFLRELDQRQIRPVPKRVMISGYAKADEVSEAMEQQLIDRFVDKPWTYDFLKDAILA